VLRYKTLNVREKILVEEDDYVPALGSGHSGPLTGREEGASGSGSGSGSSSGSAGASHSVYATGVQ
jgi:hypothetical protein